MSTGGWVVLVLGVFPALFLLLFLGGLTSAALEIRREKKAGLVPTRPAWESKKKRKALGIRGVWRAAWARASHRMETCWCGCGPLLEFEAIGGQPAGIGCVAWENGDPRAIILHDGAGGYRRTPVDAPPRRPISELRSS